MPRIATRCHFLSMFLPKFSRAVLLFAILGNPLHAQHALWYLEPATKWNEVLPIGNGRLGAMIFGGVAEEHLQLNEDTVWAG